MKVIERYILRRTFLLFAAALFWTLAIVWTTQVLARIDLVTDSGQSALTFFEMATLILPSVIPIVIPFALIIGVAQTLSVMNADSELAAVSAAGSSRMIVVRPVLILAAAASVFSFAIDNGLDPYARQRGRELVANARADLLSMVIQEGTFRKVEDGLFLQVGERLPDGTLGSIFVADSREEGVDLVYYAKTGGIVDLGDKRLLVMNDGEVHRKSPGGDVSVVHFTSYAFDMSVFMSAAKEIFLLPKDQTTQYLLNPDPSDKAWQRNPQSLRAELHRRFSEWMYPIAFALIALAVAGDARSHREGRIHPMVTAIVIALVVRWLGFTAANQTHNYAMFTPFTYLVPVVASAVAITFIANGRTMELPVSWAENIQSSLRRAGDRMSFMSIRRNRAAGRSA